MDDRIQSHSTLQDKAPNKPTLLTYVQDKESKVRRHRHTQILIVVLVALSALAVIPTPSMAVEPPGVLWQTPEDGVAGAGAGRLQGPVGIAADPVTGHVYVDDEENNRIDEYTSWGGFVGAFGWGVVDGSDVLQTCTSVCLRGLTGGGAGQFSGEPKGISVDSTGDVYVSEAGNLEAGNLRVQKFDPATGISGDEAAFLWAIGKDVDKTKVEAGGSTEAERDLCTAASGDVCQAGSAGSGTGQFDLPQGTGLAVAVTATGDVYVSDRGGEGGTRGRIQSFDANGGFVSQFDLPESGYSGENRNNTPSALALDPSTGNLYFAFFQNATSEHSPEPDVYKLSPTGAVLGKLEVDTPTAVAVATDGTVYVVEGARPGPIGHRFVSEVFEFNPSGKLVTAFAQAEAFSVGLATNPVAPSSGIPGDIYVTASADLGQRSFVTAYGPPEEFESPPKVPPSIVDQYAASVDPEDALVKGSINPEFWKDTTYYLEYGTGKCSEGGCVSEKPVAPGATLTSKLVRAPVGGSVSLTGLVSGTTYHYRFVAESGGSEGQSVHGVGGKVGVAGEEGVFMTPALPVSPPNPDPCPNAGFRVGPSALLPDCRAYEMVSPVDKNGGDVLTLLSELNFNARLDQSAVSGEAISFSSYRAFAGAQSGGWSTQYLARRGADGWSTEAISPPKGEASGAGRLPLDTTFDAFSADLSTAWLYDEGGALDPGAPGGFYNLFSRDGATGAYTAQIRAVSPHQFNDNGEGLPELQGISADGRHMIFKASDNLVAPAPEVSKTQLYEADREGEEPPQLRLVSILPNNMPVTTGASAGISNSASRRTANVNHALSEDGSRVYWTASESGPGPIYVRADGTETLPVSEAIKPVDSSPARFWAASADGSRALYDYTAGIHAGDLYEFDLAKGKSKLIAAKFLGLLGASEDLSRFYFLSDEALAVGATVGKPNLYLDEDGTFTYIAALSTDDARPGADKVSTPVNIEPYFRTARVSPDGRSLAFTSDGIELAEAVAGYDNTDQQSGEADAEVYHYAAGRLVCVSCNPTGARPIGREILFGNQHTRAWAAARLPGYAMQTYQPRYLSDDGTRLYFDSSEALLPRDTNGMQDVYEWEALGAGPGQAKCSEQNPSYSPRTGGCLSLISTGASPRDSEFIDASATGKDVFFVTLSSLVSQDPGLIDLYDAREGGGLPSLLAPPASCEGEACQGAPEPPNDASPASASFSGAGDLVPALTAVVVRPRKKSASQVRAEQFTKALKQCRRIHGDVKRKKCEAAARKRYPATPKSKTKKSNRRGK